MTLQSDVVSSCPDLHGQRVNPILVWVDELDPPKAFKERLRFPGHFYRFRKLLDALSFIRNLSDAKAILCIPVREANYEGVLETLKNVCLLNEVDYPARIEVFLLLRDDPPDDLINKFRSLGAEVRWRLDPEDAAKCIDYLRRRLAISFERKVILELTYPDPNDLRLVLHGSCGRIDYRIGDRLKRTVEVLEEHPNGISTKRLAEELGVSIKTPKKYMGELRNEHNRIKTDVGETIPGDKVFVSELLPGGWWHKLVAKIVK